MQDLYQSFINVDNIFWGDDVFRWWFYIAIVLILIFEKRKTTKITLVWYSIVFLIGLFNPLSNWIMSVVAPAWQYRARLYSMLPIPQVLAVGSILFIDKFCRIFDKGLKGHEFVNRKWFPVAKLLMVGGVCILIVVGGTDVYQQDWMQPAQNLEKVPPAVLELKEKLDDHKDICVAVPDSLSSYLRQVAPEFYTPYGRFVNDFGSLLSQENPDPMTIMERAGAQSCNFIVVYDNQFNLENFRSVGYEAYAHLTGYLVYEVKGVAFTERIFNDNRQLISLMYLDENGHYKTTRGYSGIAYEYDQEGNCIKESYLNAEKARTTNRQGYSAVKKSYTLFSHQIASLVYLDDEDRPLLIEGRYETRYKYDASRRLETESYFDQNGQPMNREDLHYALRKIRYDSQGNIVGETFLDVDGNIIAQ